MRNIAGRFGTIAFLFLLAAGAMRASHAHIMDGATTRPTTSPDTQPAERYFSTEAIGQEIVHEKVIVDFSADQAMKLFDADKPGHLAADWKDQLAGIPLQNAPGARDLPNDPKFQDMMLPPGAPTVYAYVARFSKEHIVVRLSRPLGNYLWHHDEEDVATFRMARTEALDRTFGLASLTAAYAFNYKGLTQGDTEARMIELLGKPESRRDLQEAGSSVVSYPGVVITISQGRVMELETPAP